MADGEGAAARGGLLQSIKNLGQSLLGAAQTRLEILANEVEEERVRLEQLLLVTLAAVFCLGMATLLGIAFLVIYFWDTHRLITVGMLALTFLAVAVALGWNLRTRAKSRPKPFAATRGELAKDQALLREP